MDVVPDNLSLVSIYDSLLNLYKVEHLDVVVFPVVCAEYSFICSISELAGPISDSSCLDVVLQKSPDYKSSELAKRHSLRHTRSFEKFCKLFCRECLKDGCCRVTSNSYSDNAYFSKDCTKCDKCGVGLTLREKGIRYISQFPVIPFYSPGELSVLQWDDVLECSYRLVDEFNAWSDTFPYKTLILSKREH